MTNFYFYDEKEEEQNLIQDLVGAVEPQQREAEVVADINESPEDELMRTLLGQDLGLEMAGSEDREPGSVTPSAWHPLIREAGENIAAFNSGFLAGVSEIVEYPDDLYNWVVDGVNHVVPGLIPEEWKAHTFEATSRWLREEAEETMDLYGPRGSLDVINKVFYGLGYTIPDLALAGGAGASAVRAMAKYEKVPQMVAHMMGTAAYGFATGGEEKGLAFTAMEMLNAPFKNFSKPIQMLAGAAVFGGYEKAMQNPRAPGYDADEAETDAIAAAIMGGLFPLITPASQRKFSQDMAAPFMMAKNWVKSQKAQRLQPEMSAYMEELMSVNMQHLHGQSPYEGESLNAIKDLQLYASRITGQKITAEGPELQKILKDIMQSGPNSKNVEPAMADAVAESLIKGADIANELFRLEQSGLAPERVMHTPTAEEAAVKVRIAGEEHRVTPEFDIAYRQAQLKEDLLRRTEAARADKDNKTTTQAIKDILIRGYELTAGPEVKLELALNKVDDAAAVHRVMERYHTMYTSSSRARFYNEFAREAIGVHRYSEDVQLDFAAYVAATSNLNIAKRKGPEFVAGDFFKPKDNAARIKALRLKYESGQGEVTWGEFQRMTQEYFKQASGPLERLRKNGIISQKDYDAMKDIPYVTSKTLLDLARELEAQQKGVFKKDIAKSRDIPYLKKSDGSMKSEDVMFLLERHIHVMENKIDKDLFYHEMQKLAQTSPDNIAARSPIYQYTEKLPNGKRVEVSREEYLAAETKKQEIKDQMARAKDLEPEIKDAQKVEPTDVKKLASYTKATQNLLAAENNKLVKTLEKLEKRTQKLEKTISKRDANPEGFWEERAAKKASRIGKNQAKDFKVSADVEMLKADNKTLREIIAAEIDRAYELKAELKGRNIRKSARPLKQEGWTSVEFTRDGKKEYIQVNDNFLTAFEAPGGKARDVKTRIGHIVQYASLGVPMVKALSVAWNPVFGIKTAPRDINFFAFADSKVGSLAKYTAYAYPRITRNFLDVLKKGPKFTEYVTNDGLTGEAAMMTGVAMAAARARSHTTKLNRWSSQNTKTRQAYDWMMHHMGLLSATSELAVRMTHIDYLTKNLGVNNLSYKEAVHRTNRLLNFSRKGMAMEWVDNMYAFAGASAQALDGLVRAGVQDPKSFVTKSIEYATARGALAAYAYYLGSAGVDKYFDNKDRKYASDMMSRVPLDIKLRNFLIPVPGLVVEDENAKPHQGFFRVPTEANPITTAIDIMMFASLDKYYGFNLSEDYQNAWLRNLSPIDATRAAPTFAALTAIFGNYDIMNFRTIFNDASIVDPEKRFQRDTNRIAVGLGSAFGVSPVGLERAAYAVGLANNLGTGFIGTLFSQPDYSANRTTAKIWYDSLKPLAKNWIYWNRSDASMATLGDQIREQYSAVELATNTMVEDLISDVKMGRVTIEDARDRIRNQEDSWVGDRAAARERLDRNYKGWHRYQMLRDELPIEKRDLLPPMDHFMKVGSSPSVTFKAEWYNSVSGALDKETEDVFRRIASEFGFGGQRVRHYINQGMQSANVPGQSN